MKFTLIPAFCLLVLVQPGVEDALKRPILAPDQTRVDTQVWTASKVPILQIPQDPKAWEAYASSLRQRLLDEVVYRGAAREWRKQAVKVERMGEIRGDGYLIRKLRFEAVPGLHVPALLYEPVPAPSGPTPVVLNVNGHEGTGVANPYIQARCINLAKKGLYALNVEWIGQGQLASKGLVHYRMNQLDLVGTAGLAVFYESLRRSLDVALALPQADPTRIGVTGLSGGGWQTIMLSALDTRVTLSNPVAGHASYVTRAQWPNTDLGDSEQTPSDLATIADYPHLNALVAPRPLQLTYNARDNCCFKADHAAGPMVQWAAPVFRLLDAAGRFAYHVNHDEGHNYERDNREALYRFLHRHFFNGGTGFDPREIDVTRELREVAALATPLPPGNADFQAIATRIADGLPPAGEPRRERLADLLRARRYEVRAAAAVQENNDASGAASWRLHMEHWTVPLVEIGPGGAVKGTTLVLADEGRRSAGDVTRRLMGEGRRVAAMDPFYFGESALGERDFLFGLLVSALGERPLGVQASQVAASARWLAARHGSPVAIAARGPRTSLIALVAAALEPDAISGVELTGGWRTLREVLTRSISAEEMPEMFAFGLLAEFDVPQMERLVQPRPVVYR
ncbi:MAG: acetylxylan esterase [Acidobacteriota bacterium]|nr:acetylxylan esterase [Acidobacteriota bacterium]